ncbi:putative serine/threonine protein kinase [Nocardia nova SH22a]|uniref:Putative serine/threonine protein kinase n=1 Tax=Nocardia nova SH22a TaxID=1415166 RepID=W5TH74_9NOCA|nr:serine/threonine-protein kinase [Nocardia nova]AHH18504.1 putative serine/threonine protein kinase [Nocardia nova SH22a]
MRPPEPGDPETIGPYRILGVLGAGGMGKVYLGRTAGGRTVAVKVVRPDLSGDPAFRTRFRREVAAARRVTGTCAVPVLDADVDAQRPWLATAYVAGLSLGEAVDQFGPLPEQALAPLTAGLARALAEVHAAGVIHRDLKPSNVLLTVDGPRLIDFGIARAADDGGTLTTTGQIIGSPGYIAPEHISGEGPVGPPADVFALGGVLVYAATGQGPFGNGDSISMLWRVMYEPPQLDSVPDDIRALTAACLDKDPARRPAPEQISGLATTSDTGALPAAILEAIGRRAVAVLDLDPATTLPPTMTSAAPTPPPVQPRSTHSTIVTGRPEIPSAPSRSPVRPPTHLPTAHTAQPPPQRNSPRRRTLALAGGAAVVLVAAATISATLAFRSASADRPATAHHTTPAVTTSADTPADDRTALPPAFTGTWTGTATDGAVQFRIVVTLHDGTVGTEVGTATNTGQRMGTTCKRAETLTAANPSKITLRARLLSGFMCNDDNQPSTLVLRDDGGVNYSMTGPIGTISGTLHRR